jgi:hypothetical protein
MKTLKQITTEVRERYTSNPQYFKEGYSKKMGGTQKIVFENDFLPSISFDDREYYQGRGKKYNSSSMHQHIDVYVSKHEFETRIKTEAKASFKRMKEFKKEEIVRKNNFKKLCTELGVEKSNYTSAYGNELYFEPKNASKIEIELEVDIDAFMESTGKTYFFANSPKLGLLMFYHNHRQSFSFSKCDEEYLNEFKKDRNSWVNARYAHLLGDVTNENLYVC